MKKTILLALICVMCCGMLAYAAPKKVALVGRISWCPGSTGSTSDRDFDVMATFSMDDENLDMMLQDMGYESHIMPDYVVQYLLNEGICPFDPGDDADYFGYVNDGEYMIQPDFFQINDYEAAWITGTCWSSIAPNVQNVPIGVIEGEHSCIASNTSKMGTTYMFFGEATGDARERNKIILTDAGKAHPLCAGLPDEIIVFGGGPTPPEGQEGNTYQSIHVPADDAAPGTTVLAVYDPEGPNGTTGDGAPLAAWAVVDQGGELADGSAAAGRRAMVFFGGGEVRPINGSELPPVWLIAGQYISDDGQDVIHRTIKWLMNEDPTSVDKWAMK